MRDAASLPVDALALRCTEETEKYYLRQQNDTQYCFELLRRALGQGRADALAHAYRIYERRVLAWVYSHSRFTQTGEDAEFFASWALHTCFAALRGEKFERFPSLAQILKYLKVCVHTAIVRYLRDAGTAPTVSLDALPEQAAATPLGAGVEAAELWDHICRLLPDPRDRLLAHCVLVQDLPPRQIIVAHPGQWRDVREVTVATYRIRQMLRNDPEVRRRAGGLADAERERGV